MQNNRNIKIIVWILFLIYAGVMLYLLFIQRLLFLDIEPIGTPDDYWYAVGQHFEPVPFRTIVEFIGRIEAFSVSDLAFRNLAGNIVLFVPIGLFLPLLFKKQRRFVTFLMTTAAVILTVELTQMFTLLGTCDIDDLILNTAGACIGYVVFMSFAGRHEKHSS